MYLLFDSDRSTATIGGEEGVRRLLGVEPVPITGGLSEVGHLLTRLFQRKRTPKSHPAFGEMKAEQVEWVPTEHMQGLGIQGVILDTLTSAVEQEIRLLVRHRSASIEGRGGQPIEALDKQGYGLLKGRVLGFLEFARQLPTAFIMTCHGSWSLQETGGRFYQPDIPGSSARTLPRYFDAVLFNRVEEDGLFYWQGQPDAARIAKDRTGKLPELLAQDYAALLDTYAEHGVEHPKILTIGESGTGKTRAIATLSTQPPAR